MVGQGGVLNGAKSTLLIRAGGRGNMLEREWINGGFIAK